MSVFESFTRKVTETAKAAAKKSSDLVEVTKLNMGIGTEEDKIERVYKEIGKAVYESYIKGEAINEVFIEKCKEIGVFEENIKEMRSKVLELKNSKICPNCHEQLDVDVLYCSKCGVKQEVPQFDLKEEEPSDKACPNCGASNDINSLFCPKCGTKLD